MHISEPQTSPNTIILTKCSKMTEEGHRRYGMNGNVDRIPKEECHKPNYGQGGRLKFFKDGKFILELERAREGERVSWVSVPRKTFWPPPGTAASTPAYKQESSTSLSVSDDNSSIQSSPWQRDHSWKQTTPRRNISQEMALLFWRPKRRRRHVRGRGVKRRRPLSVAENKDEDAGSRMKEKKRRRSLLVIVQTLLERNCRTSTPPRPETVVSPRKRFLREMEKERTPSASSSPSSDRPGSSDDGSSNSAQKRSRGRPQGSTCPPVAKTPPTSLIKADNKGDNSTPPPLQTPARCNGIDDVSMNTTKPTKNCSYSITALLAEDHHKNSLKHSPSHSPNRFSPVVSQVGPTPSSIAQYLIASDDRLCSESIARLRSIELSQAEKCYPPPSYPPQPYINPSFNGFMLPLLTHYYNPAVYGRAGYVPQPMYTQHPTQPHPLPPHAPHPMIVRREAHGPAPTWPREESVREVTNIRDEPLDMPLNLSKHSG
ncbi:hypothetical protein GWI33_017399 [Rhynchophorus ferrugineus]|uniref:Protein hairless n=1 Tax=Rhynchophorus ferrugineus TaxID=354439 RepID=A0A834IPF3_RHYFE|nr:hypothetical protein GWI33_017399 [Rhynchophorus ferrugineus]